MALLEDWEFLRNQVEKLRTEISALELSSNLVLMLIAAEDHRYGKHPGVDMISVFRAIWRSLFCGKREGASTIAMQLVRVTTGRYERTIKRKIIEMYLAMRLTRNFDEHDIPKMYLAVAYYGWKMNGLKQASNRLHLNQSSLTLNEAASIVARLKYPEPKQPSSKRYRQIEERAKYILRRADNLCPYLDVSRFIVRNADGAL